MPTSRATSIRTLHCSAGTEHRLHPGLQRKSPPSRFLHPQLLFRDSVISKHGFCSLVNTGLIDGRCSGQDDHRRADADQVKNGDVLSKEERIMGDRTTDGPAMRRSMQTDMRTTRHLNHFLPSHLRVGTSW